MSAEALARVMTRIAKSGYSAQDFVEGAGRVRRGSIGLQRAFFRMMGVKV